MREARIAGGGPEATRLGAARVRATLFERLTARRDEIEEAILTRVHSVDDPTGRAETLAYDEGLRAAVRSAIDYAIQGTERGETRTLPIPPQLFAQVRTAARSGISLYTVLRRYFVGFTLLGDFIMQEAKDGELLDAEEIQRLTRNQAELFDRIVAAVSVEYRSEAEAKSHSFEHRAEQAERLLAGGLTNADHLAYDLDAWHIAVIGVGPEAEPQLQSLAATLDRRPLLLPRGGEIVWGWLGGRRKIDCVDLLDAAAAEADTALSLAVGEPAWGLSGWRLTHRQAQAALPFVLRSPRGFARYADVALLASIRQDKSLVHFLHQAYLAPLASEPDGGAIFFRTLRAYYAAERHVSSAATVLGVSRNTVAGRLKAVEDLLERPLATCAAELEAALRLEELEGWPQL